MRETVVLALPRRMTTNTKSITEIEARLAKDVRSYLAVYGQGDSAEEECLRRVASSIEWLTWRLLDGNELWETCRSCDGILPGSGAAILAPRHIRLDGLLVFGDSSKGRGYWWEPFSGAIQIAETNDEVISYQLMLGDKAWGLGSVRYDEHPRGWNWSQPKEWIFVFSKP